MTSLMAAVKADDLDSVESLLSGGAEVNQADGQGDWPLIMAAYLGHVAVLRKDTTLLFTLAALRMQVLTQARKKRHI